PGNAGIGEGSPALRGFLMRILRTAGSLAALLFATSIAPAADQKTIDAAVQRGTIFLKSRFKNGGGAFGGNHGIGPTAISGIALLAAKVPGNDPALVAST